MTFRKRIKSLSNIITHPFGLNIVRHFGNDPGLKKINNVFRHEAISLLLDVGAFLFVSLVTILSAKYTSEFITTLYHKFITAKISVN